MPSVKFTTRAGLPKPVGEKWPKETSSFRIGHWAFVSLEVSLSLRRMLALELLAGYQGEKPHEPSAALAKFVGGLNSENP
jgi:hypothetical protein